MKILFYTLLFVSIGNLSAQKEGKRFVNDTGNKTSKYASTYPIRCYNSKKLDSLLPREGYDHQSKLNDETFQSLNALEYFIFAFNHPEWYFQSCSMFPYPKNILQVIPGQILRQGEGFRMSQRQADALRKNRDSTLLLMKNCIINTGKVTDDFKRRILFLDAYELIPTLIEISNTQKEYKDPYILSTLCLLMAKEYHPFINSEIYKQLYAVDSSNTNNSNYYALYNRTIPFTHENFHSILTFATGFYNLRKSVGVNYVMIPGGSYEIGEEGHSTNPLSTVELQAFYISRYEVTNAQFKSFVDSTGYITLAEKYKDAFVFKLGLDEFEWIQDSTANWRFPNGVSAGGIEGMLNHPVTCISYEDALAYCKWAHVRLPFIEEWEVASRGNTNFKRHYFGDSSLLIFKHANIWHGLNHKENKEGSDYLTTAPVGTYLPNQFGLYDMYGNVFEFCAKTPEVFKNLNGAVASRGGSWWCSLTACGFFNSVDIGRVQRTASFSNNGFRVVYVSETNNLGEGGYE